MTSFWSCFQFPDIFFCALCQTHMKQIQQDWNMSNVASRAVHLQLIMYETFFNDGLPLPDLHRPRPPPWRTLHSTHITPPPHSHSIWSGIARRPRSASAVSPRDADHSRSLCVSRLIHAPDGFCRPGLSGWERQKAARSRRQMFASGGSERRSDTPLLLRVLFVVALQKNDPSLVDWHQAASPHRRAASRGSRHSSTI